MPPEVRLPQKLSQAMAGKITDPKVGEIYSHFIQACGGTKDFAQKMYDVFDAAEAGSLVQQRIMDMVLRMGRFVNERAPTEELGILSDDDLVNHLSVLMEKANGSCDESPPIQPEGRDPVHQQGVPGPGVSEEAGPLATAAPVLLREREEVDTLPGGATTGDIPGASAGLTP